MFLTNDRYLIFFRQSQSSNKDIKMEIKSNDSAQSDVEMKSSSEQETKPKKPKEVKHSPKVKRELDDLKQVSDIKYNYVYLYGSVNSFN